MPYITFLAALALQPEPAWSVQPYYLYPSDQPFHQEYVDSINKLLPEVQEWYRAQAGVTFRLLPLQTVKGGTYLAMRGGRTPAEEVKNDIQKMPHWWDAMDEVLGAPKPKQVSWVFAQGGGGWAGANLWGDYTGKAIFGDWVLEPISGVREPAVIHSGFATWQVQGGTPKGTTVHELGHAFGLHHPDKYEGKSIMKWHGDYPATGLLPHEIMILKNSPYFVQNAYDRNAPWIDFEIADVMEHGKPAKITGRGFRKGDTIEFRHVAQADWPKIQGHNTAAFEKSVRIKPDIRSQTSFEVAVPQGLGPGFVRIWRGKLRGNAVPVNFYPPS